MARVPLAEFEPALSKKLEELWGTPPNLYRALGNQPRLVAAWAEFSRVLRHEARTPRALRELLILRGAQLVRSEYEWAQHLPMARKAGVREAQIAALAKAVTEGRVSDRVYAEASKHFDPADYVELCLVAAFYAAVGRMIDALGVQLEPEMRSHSPCLPAK